MVINSPYKNSVIKNKQTKKKNSVITEMYELEMNVTNQS